VAQLFISSLRLTAPEPLCSLMNDGETDISFSEVVTHRPNKV